VQVRELKRPVIALENFGHQNGKMRLKVCLVRKGLNPKRTPPTLINKMKNEMIQTGYLVHSAKL